MESMHWDKICSACQSIFTEEAIRVLQKRPSHSSRLDRTTHLSYGELLLSAESCHLCEWIVASTTPVFKERAHTRIETTTLSVRVRETLHGVTSLSIYADLENETEDFVVKVFLSPLNAQKRDNVIARRLTPRNTLNETTISQIQQWTTECISSHTICNKISKITSPNQIRPCRLLEIYETGRKLRVTSTETILSGDPYVSLSHCWGGSLDCRLLAENVHLYSDSIPLELLPRTFKECVEVVHRLGFRYLWIDALCIVQDSESDWLAESSKMGDIYAHAVLNIAATASKNGRQGLFRSPPSLAPCILQFPEEDGQYPTTFVTHHTFNYYNQIEDSPLNKRGWVLQERALSPRTVHFALGEIFWECHRLVASETLVDTAYLVEDNVKFKMAPAPHRQERIFQTWRSIVHEYSHRQLTRGSDKLPALSGMARRVALQLKVGSDAYLAGLWRVNSAIDLLWSTHPRHTRVDHGRAPSWSWARIDGKIGFAQRQGCPQIRILDAAVQRVSDAFGAVGQGFITLQGPLCRLKLTGTKRLPTFHELISEEIGTFDGQATISAQMVEWDDWTGEDESTDQPLYLLICDNESRRLKKPSCIALLLLAVGSEDGQYERLGLVDRRVSSMDDFLSITMNPELLGKAAYEAFDPSFGFTITIH